MTAARRRARPAALLLAALCLLVPAGLAGCTSFAHTLTAGTPPAGLAEGRPACPARPVAPDPHRPRITLDFRLADDLRTVTGTETVVFTPDRRTGELVFRLVPNGPGSAAAGNRLTVDGVRGDDVAGGSYAGDGAAAPGGLYRVALRKPVAAGASTRVELRFTLALGAAGFDRFGVADGVSWWASGAPLLAWEPGVGWARDPFTDVLGETATSPAADTTVRVSAPAELTVLMTGDQAAPGPPVDGRRTWTSKEAAARDVSVAAGRFTTQQATTPGGVRVTAGVLPGATLDAGGLAGWTTDAIAALEHWLGRFPYRTLTVPLLPDYGGGIEYPGSILLATESRPVLVHEVAHMWFYGMVGNDQYRDPWLDEAFASYAEGLVDPPPAAGLERVLQRPGRVGAAIGSFPNSNAYFATVYDKGEAALLTARQKAGPDAFDAAVRCYVNANAWRIATPRDVARALKPVPAAVQVLLDAGALQPGDLTD